MPSTSSVRTAARIATVVIAVAGAAACASRPATTPESTRSTEVMGPGGEGRQGRMYEMMFEGITLSPQQRASIDSIHAAYRSRMGAPRDSGDRAQMRQMMEEHHAAIRNVLTADQQRIFDANMERMRHEHEHGRGRGRRAS